MYVRMCVCLCVCLRGCTRAVKQFEFESILRKYSNRSMNQTGWTFCVVVAASGHGIVLLVLLSECAVS